MLGGSFTYSKPNNDPDYGTGCTCHYMARAILYNRAKEPFMEDTTLATVTSAVVTLALDAAKEAASNAAKSAWGKIKGWLKLDKDPATEDLAREVATALKANTAAAEQIVAELKTSQTGAASRLASKVTISVTNTTGAITAGGKVVIVQAKDMTAQRDMNIGAG
jgi:hypothetical protein